MKEIRVDVFGEVQGVGFRSFVKHVANKLGVNGYVKNMEDGGVLVVAHGSKKNLEKLLSAVKNGPDGARVEKVDFSWGNMEKIFDDFITI